MKLKQKQLLLQKRRWRIRKKINGTAEKPRVCVRFSNKHIYAQCIDDEQGKTLAYASSNDKELRGENLKSNAAGAAVLGKKLAEKAVKQNVNDVVFDRGGRRYHGVVKAFADAAREGGLKF